MHDYILDYYQQIKDGRATVGKWIKLLYSMVITSLENHEYTHDLRKSAHAIDWIEAHCFHTEGDLAPNPLKLEIWQKAFVSMMFGLVDKDGKRHFREVLLVIGRKNGKTLLASAIARYMWVNDGFGTRIFNIAPKLDQADLVYNSIWMMTQLDPEYQEKEARRKERDSSRRKLNEDDPTQEHHRMTDLYIPGINSSVKKIAFSAKKSDGFNPSLCICDEIASWQGDPGLKQYEVMKSGMGARSQSILLSCTTSGYANDSIYDEIMKRSTRLLLGESKEKRLLPVLYMIDDIEKWNDINELRKSNPNLGTSVTVDYMLEEIAIAEGSLSKRTEFLTKYCNIKQPGIEIEIFPPQLHKHLQLSSKAGILDINCLPPGVHGYETTGTQGIGVRTPIAAAVAEATVGLAIDWHIPNGIMLTMGLLSIILAIGLFCTIGRIGSATIKVDGAIPKLHCSIAPVHTNFAISLIYYILFFVTTI